MFELDFERRVAAALRARVPTDARMKQAIMERVRAAAIDGMPKLRDPFLFTQRGTRHSLVGLALAAGVGSITTLSSLIPMTHGADTGASAYVIGDSVVATLRDTLRLVRLIFDAPRAREVAVVGDFNDWRAGVTPLHRNGTSHRWSATLALRDGAHRYAFVVDGARWVPDQAAAPVTDDGRVYSVLHVARAIN